MNTTKRYQEVRTAGGFGQMGGHGPLTNMFGLGADQPLEYKVVTTDGKLRVANAYENPDLFWALRGGGGSTFGVVVEATVRAYPTPSMSAGIFVINATDHTNPGDDYWETVAELHRELPALVAQGVVGYYYIYPVSTTVALMKPNTDNVTLAKIIDPLAKRMGAFKGMNIYSPVYSTSASYKEWFDTNLGSIDGGGNAMNMSKRASKRTSRRAMPGMSGDDDQAEPNGYSYMDSRLLGARHFNNPNLAAALKASIPPTTLGMLRGNIVGGGAVANPKEFISANPAWRTALLHVIASGHPGNWTIDPIRAISPDSGAYGNEVSNLKPV
jgi:hypothetical protein